MNHRLIQLHRYLGIAVGTLMAMWCLSGVVMMYVSYPALKEHDRLKALAPIDWNDCCTIPAAALGDADRVGELQIEMLAGRPTLEVGRQEHSRLIDLRTGLLMPRVSPEQARAAALGFRQGNTRDSPRSLGTVDSDQWTVSGEFTHDRPLYHFALDDTARTEIYISSSSGRAVQLTTASDRFWSWLGAIPHWLYFTQLRRNAHLWSQVVIATSLVGCFLVITGLYVGVRQLTLRPAGHWSTHRGVNLWHHIAGLIFGTLALTWVFSGFVSMNPWGWLEGDGVREQRLRLRGDDLVGADIKAAVRSIANTRRGSIASLGLAPLDGRVYFTATDAAGDGQRLDAVGNPAPLRAADLHFLAGALGGAETQSLPQLMTQEDAYYFTHHGEALPMPVYRMIVADNSAVRYYLDAVSGSLLLKVDRNARGYRWLHEGLHRLDFAPALRGRPQWDVLMLLLLCGVTTLCATGAYLGYRRVARSFRD